MHIHDRHRPCKKEGPAVEQMIKILGPLGKTTITKTINFSLIFGG